MGTALYFVVDQTSHYDYLSCVQIDSPSGTAWNRQEVANLRNLARQNMPTRVVGLKLGRTADAIRTRASQENISLKPTL
jgi:hypothetical protein